MQTELGNRIGTAGISLNHDSTLFRMHLESYFSLKPIFNSHEDTRLHIPSYTSNMEREGIVGKKAIRIVNVFDQDVSSSIMLCYSK